MPQNLSGWVGVIASSLLLLSTAGATSVPSLSFEQLTDKSELVVTGQINRSWADWDAGHKYIWTHYELAVSSVLKGSPGATVVLSEPGGVVGLHGMSIAGTVVYNPGDQVLLFLERMPNGYLRTTGWGQGKYLLDKQGNLYATARLVEMVDARGRPAARSFSLGGMTLAQVRTMVTARVQSQGRTK